MITNISSLPPPIIQDYSAALLSTPKSKFSDDEESIWKLWEKFLKKFSGQKIDETLKNEFLEVYGLISKKKENIDPKIKNKTQEFHYCLECPDKLQQEILLGFKYSARFVAACKPRKYRTFQKR